MVTLILITCIVWFLGPMIVIALAAMWDRRRSRDQRLGRHEQRRR